MECVFLESPTANLKAPAASQIQSSTGGAGAAGTGSAGIGAGAGSGAGLRVLEGLNHGPRYRSSKKRPCTYDSMGGMGQWLPWKGSYMRQLESGSILQSII